LKATNTDITIGKNPIGQTQFLKRKNFSFFEDTENCPKITTLLPQNHRMDFCGDSEY